MIRKHTVGPLSRAAGLAPVRAAAALIAAAVLLFAGVGLARADDDACTHPGGCLTIVGKNSGAVFFNSDDAIAAAAELPVGTMALSSDNYTTKPPVLGKARSGTAIVPTASESCPPMGLRAAADRFDAIAKDIDKVTGWGGAALRPVTALKVDAGYLRQMARCLREQSEKWGIP